MALKRPIEGSKLGDPGGGVAGCGLRFDMPPFDGGITEGNDLTFDTRWGQPNGYFELFPFDLWV